jgi:hypothetical protein
MHRLLRLTSVCSASLAIVLIVLGTVTISSTGWADEPLFNCGANPCCGCTGTCPDAETNTGNCEFECSTLGAEGPCNNLCACAYDQQEQLCGCVQGN